METAHSTEIAHTKAGAENHTNEALMLGHFKYGKALEIVEGISIKEQEPTQSGFQ